MWHILKKFNRVVARQVSEEEATKLFHGVGGEIKGVHIPPKPNLMGYIVNEKPIYSYGQYIIEVDGKELCVTRKDDAFRIMQALKRDYKEIYVRLK